MIKINKKTINVATKKGVMQGPPPAFSLPTKKVSAKEVVFGKVREYPDYSEGDTAFFVNNDEIIPVVIAKEIPKGNVHAYVIGKEGKYYHLKSSNSFIRLFQTEAEANKFRLFGISGCSTLESVL